MPHLDRADLVGLTFGRLKVKHFSHVDSKRRACWICECECGGLKTASTWHLRRARVQSCGCLHSEAARKQGLANRTVPIECQSEYTTWLNIKARCLNPKSHNYKDYGGRGVSVCSNWKNDFARFLQDVGKKPTPDHQLDRINNDRNYEPGNVRWATKIENANNKRNSRFLTYNDETLTIAQWARKVGIKVYTIHTRLNAAWSVNRVLTTPLQNAV